MGDRPRMWPRRGDSYGVDCFSGGPWDAGAVKGAIMSGPPADGALLDLLEPGWRRHLASGEPAGTLDVEPEVLDAAARTLGDLSRSESPMALSRRWPACIVVAVAQVTARHDQNGKDWRAWHRAP